MGKNKRAYSPKAESPVNIIRNPQDKDDKDGQPVRFWKAPSIFYGLGANGKQSRGNMGAAAVFTGILKNGRQRVSLKSFGYWVWKNMMRWTELAGNDKALTAV